MLVIVTHLGTDFLYISRILKVVFILIYLVDIYRYFFLSAVIFSGKRFGQGKNDCFDTRRFV